MPSDTSPLPFTPAAKFAVSKALAQCRFIDRSLRLGVWTDATYETWVHDLAVMHAHGNLRRVRLELLAADGRVLAEFAFGFQAPGPAGPVRDVAAGVELPLLDRSRVTGHRVVADNHRADDSAYRHHLRMRWGAAEPRARAGTEPFESEHARKITGGRQAATFHVPADARHRLRVTQTGSRDFAFAHDLTLGVGHVYLLARFAPPGLRFAVGQELTAVVVQTPRGLQARNIQAAG